MTAKCENVSKDFILSFFVASDADSSILHAKVEKVNALTKCCPRLLMNYAAATTNLVVTHAIGQIEKPDCWEAANH